QAEDGIRDGHVTGVQTCALPISCRKPFTVRMWTIFESSHVPLRIWLQAIYLMCSSKKGISTRQLHRTFGGSLKTAWFLGHRIRRSEERRVGKECRSRCVGAE